MKKIFQVAFLLWLPLSSLSQSVGVGTTTPDASAKVDITATDAGLLIPRISLTSTTDATTIPNPATSLLVYNTNVALPDSIGFYYNAGTPAGPLWVRLKDGNSEVGWLLDGNSGTDPNLEFLGTTDAVDLSFRTNNTLTVQLKQNTALWTKSDNTMLGDSTGADLTSGARNTTIGYHAGKALNSSNNNTFVGYNAGRDNSGGANVFMGHRSGQNNIDGGQNVYIGDYASAGDTTGSQNVVIGAGAGDNGPDAGNNNVQIGFWSGRTSAGTGNILIGRSTGYYNDTSHLIAIGHYAGPFNTTGYGNIMLGAYSGYANSIGSRNISIGGAARRLGSTGNDNIAIGDSALFASNGSNNVSIGTKTARYNTNGGNTVVGHYAFAANTTGSNNTVFGREAMEYDTLGAGNVAIGWRAMRHHFDGVDNVAVGTGALEFSGDNSYNVAVGRSAMFNNERSNLNVALGFNTLASMTYNPGSPYVGGNTAVGSYALRYLNPTTSGEGQINTAVGYSSMMNSITAYGNTSVGMYSSRESNGNNNSVLGREAFQYDTTGSGNVAIGWRALRNHQTGNDNVAVGTGAMENSDSNYYNVAVGRSAMFNNQYSNYNVAVGYSSLLSMTYSGGGHNGANTAVGSNSMRYTNPTSASDARYNAALGNASMFNNLTGSFNTSLGVFSMYSATTAEGNTVVGAYAADDNNGSNNVAIGREAFRFDTTGSGNVAVGYRAMYQHYNGQQNVAIGTGAMENSDDAAYSVGVGRSAIRFNTDSFNVGIGYYAGLNSTGARNVYIGPYAGASATGDDELFIDNSSTSNPLIYGDFQNDRVGMSTGSPEAYLEIFNNSTTNVPHLLLQEDNSDFARLAFSNTNDTRQWHIAGMIDPVNYLSDDLNFWHTNTGNIMNISATGRVGILTTGPGAVLDVRGDAIFNDDGGNYDFRIEGNTNTHLLFTDASADRVGIGTNAPADLLEVAGNVRLDHPSASSDYLLSFNGIDPALYPAANNYGMVGTSTNRLFEIHAYTITYYANLVNASDRRIKENVHAVNRGLEKVLQLKPVQYDIKTSFLADSDQELRQEIEKDRKNHIGFIAQDVYEVIPEVVSYDEENDLYGIKYVELVPLLTKAIQEQQEVIDSQQVELNDYKKLLTELQKQFHELKMELEKR